MCVGCWSKRGVISIGSLCISGKYLHKGFHFLEPVSQHLCKIFFRSFVCRLQTKSLRQKCTSQILDFGNNVYSTVRNKTKTKFYISAVKWKIFFQNRTQLGSAIGTTFICNVHAMSFIERKMPCARGGATKNATQLLS